MNNDAYDDKVSKLRAIVTELEEELSTLCEERDYGITNFGCKQLLMMTTKVALYVSFLLPLQSMISIEIFQPHFY